MKSESKKRIKKNQFKKTKEYKEPEIIENFVDEEQVKGVLSESSLNPNYLASKYNLTTSEVRLILTNQ